jgi:hypothetical protein
MRRGGRRAARAVSTGEDGGGDEQGTGGTRAARTRTPRWHEAVRGYERAESESGPAPDADGDENDTPTSSERGERVRRPSCSAAPAKTMAGGDENGTGGAGCKGVKARGEGKTSE